MATSSDFGKNGDRPTHPELLDWLALRFSEEGWSMKAMHRLMVASSTYRQSAENPRVADPALDPENRLLWRYSRRRLEAEAIRDSILSVSGRLSTERGGPSVFPPLPESMADLKHMTRPSGSMWEPNEKESDCSAPVDLHLSAPLPSPAHDGLVRCAGLQRILRTP